MINNNFIRDIDGYWHSVSCIKYICVFAENFDRNETIWEIVAYMNRNNDDDSEVVIKSDFLSEESAQDYLDKMMGMK